MKIISRLEINTLKIGKIEFSFTWYKPDRLIVIDDKLMNELSSKQVHEALSYIRKKTNKDVAFAVSTEKDNKTIITPLLEQKGGINNG